jgi:glyoxylase-like metal-dependent hydrolase (beta-lactamase superfamily II)
MNNRMKRISSYVYQISLGFVNVFIIEDEGLTLIDTGPRGSAAKILNAIRRAGKNPYDIKQIILTHAHPDHAGSAEELKRILRVPVLAHYHDARIAKYGIGFRNEMQITPGIKNWLIYQCLIRRSGIDIEPVAIDETLKDNDILPVLGGTRIIHTPGHTIGHICLLTEGGETLIAGDLLSNSLYLGLSVCYENMDDGLNSIQKTLNYGFTKIGFGHGQAILKGAANVIRGTFDNYPYSFA